MKQQLLYSIAQTCELTGLGRTKVYELLAKGVIPVRKVGSRTLIAADDLKHWVDRLPLTMASQNHTRRKQTN